MDRASQRFDRELFTLKLCELTRQMQIKTEAASQIPRGRWGVSENRWLAYRNIVDALLPLLREWLGGADRICREVWQTQGEAITPEFVREVLLPEVMTSIEEGSRVASVHVVRILVWAQPSYLAQQHLAREMGRLKEELNTRYEIEARELEYREDQSDQSGESVTTPTGRNIDRLRKECGWSLDRLAEKSGIDKKLILSHVNKGVRPIPRILKEYAQAFSKELGRTIIAPDLEK
jgi:hypothetical protein